MSREQQSQQGQLDTVEEDAREQEAEHGLPPVVQARVMRLGPADDEALRVLLREWPAYTHAILQVAAHQMGNIAVIRALETPKADGATEPQAITGYKPPIPHENIHKFIDDPSDQPKVAPPETAATDAGAATGDAAAATTKVLTVPGEPAWFAGARTYNLAHPELVEQFNAATDQKFIGADGTLDLQGIWSWQSHHGLVHDGKIGPHTNDAAKALKTKAEPKVEEHKPKIEEPKIEEPKPKLEEIKPKLEETKPPKIEEPKPKLEEPKPKLEEPRPRLEEPKPRLEEPKPKLENHTSTVKLSEPTLQALAAKVHDPHLDGLLQHLATVLSLDKTLRATRSSETGNEEKGSDREVLVHEIGLVRSGLAALNASSADVVEFKVAVNHKLEEVAPYHSQLNINSVESVGGWSTCNLTSLAMALEVLGFGPASYPNRFHARLVAVAKVFHKDIAQARLASHGTDANALSSLMGLRFPDFLQLAGVVHTLRSNEPTKDNILAAANDVVHRKGQIGFLSELAGDFGATAKPQSVKWDTDAKKSVLANEQLEQYGEKHRGDHRKNLKVEYLNTLRNKMERESNPTKKAEIKKQYDAQLVTQQSALDGKDIESTLAIDTYRTAVTRDLGVHLDAGAGVMAGLYYHWTRLYAIDAEGVRVQDPGQFARSEVKISWAEARAMGYFWANLVLR